MKELFAKYGDACKFDLTYKVFRHRSSKNKEWGLGIFSGFNVANKPILFGFSLSSRQEA